VRLVEQPDPDQPSYLALRVAQYACANPACTQKYFTPVITEAAPYAHTSRRLQSVATARSRQGRAPLRQVAAALQTQWHTRTGKSSVLRWHQATVAQDYPRPARLPFSGVLCIDEVYDRVGGRQQPIFTCVDRLAGITVRSPVERTDAGHLAAARRQVQALGAQPRVIVSDLWAAYPEALAAVWPHAQRQLCWFHVMHWVTRQLARLLKDYGATLPTDQRKELTRLRFLLLASPEKQQRLGPRAQAALARAWELIADSLVAEAIQLRNDLRAILNTSTTRGEAREQFDQVRQSWPACFQPWTWRPGTPLVPPQAPATEGTTGLREYLEAIMAFFVRHFEWMLTYLDAPDVPRTNNHAERANRCWRAIARPRYGWATTRGQRAMLIALHGFDSS
jgi:hypothetical protein